MKKEKINFYDILIRYIILIIIAIPNLFIFYFIFTPLTLYPVYWILSLFYATFLDGTTIFIKSLPIELVDACIAGAAYYLLLILNLSVPEIKFSKRLKMILFAFVSLLVLNIIRIVLLSFMYISGSQFFDFTHKLFWYAISIIFVVAIWFYEVKIFKIKNIPVYTDLKNLYLSSTLSKIKK